MSWPKDPNLPEPEESEFDIVGYDGQGAPLYRYQVGLGQE